jgi:hypothetical protein
MTIVTSTPGAKPLVIANISQADAPFWWALSALFCDPDQSGRLADFKSGAMAVHFNPSSHELELRDALNPEHWRN